MAEPTTNSGSGCCFPNVTCFEKSVAILKIVVFVLSLFAIVAGGYFIFKGFPSWLGDLKNISPISTGISMAAAGVIGLVTVGLLNYCCKC